MVCGRVVFMEVRDAMYNSTCDAYLVVAPVSLACSGQLVTYITC